MLIRKLGHAAPNILLMYASSVIGGALFFLPILALYFEDTLFSATNVALIFSIEAFAVVLFEVPTGAIADLFGRKMTIVLDHVITLCAIGLLFIGGSLWIFIIYAIIHAFAMSLASGSEDALIYDTLQEHGKEQYYKRAIGIYYALWPLGASVGAIIGGYLATISLEHTILFSFIPVGIATILVAFLKEAKYEKEKHQNVLRQMNDAFRFALSKKQLILLFIGGFVLMAFGESLHLLKPLFFEEKEITLQAYGYLYAGTFGLAAVGYYLSDTISLKIGDRRTLLIFSIINPFIVIAAS